ncbi:DUF930 domain-containing protein [Camelimonas sp. ID_303_24]
MIVRYPSGLPALALLVSAALALQSSFAVAYDARLRPQFDRLEYDTRLEEVCGTEVGLRISREHRGFLVDKVVADTFRREVQVRNRIVAKGAVFRSRGKWFHLAFECETGPHHMDVHKMSYSIGAEIPRSQWARHYLYD